MPLKKIGKSGTPKTTAKAIQESQTGMIAKASNITVAGASAAKRFPVSNHFALVEDFLSAAGAIHSNTGPGDQRF